MPPARYNWKHKNVEARIRCYLIGIYDNPYSNIKYASINQISKALKLSKDTVYIMLRKMPYVCKLVDLHNPRQHIYFVKEGKDKRNARFISENSPIKGTEKTV